MTEIDVIGFGRDSAFGIPTKERIHMAIFGEVASGKSETLKLLILQNIKREEGFLLIDPHGMLARSIMGLIPKDQWEKVVYVSPASVQRYGRTVQINPLQYNREEERPIVAMSFVDALHNLHRDSWGDRLETILRNACNVLTGIRGSTLKDMQRLVSDQEARDRYLSRISDRDTIRFWRTTFEKQYSRDAGSVAYNKLDKILATPPVAAILDTPTSSIDFGEALEEGRFIIVDLATGTSDDITSFLGSIILHMIYVEARKRIDNSKSLTVPFYIYIDEAHMFSPFALRELLNTMRKFNVKVTLATQTISAYPKQIAEEISSLARTILCFRCDHTTAQSLGGLLPLQPEEITGLSLHRFAFYSQGAPPIVGVAKTIPIHGRLAGWEEVAKFSVERYGRSIQKMPTEVLEGFYPPISPLEFFIMALLRRRDSRTKEELFEEVSSLGQARRVVYEGIESLVRRRYLTRNIREDGRYTQQFSVSSQGIKEAFPTAAVGRRAGSTLHLAAIFLIARIMEWFFRYSIVDLGGSLKQRPDILIFEPLKNQHKYSHELWGERITAVEVETDPTKHPEQTMANYTKNIKKGYKVWFVVFSESHSMYIDNALRGKDQYSVIVLSKGNALRGYETLYEDISETVARLEIKEHPKDLVSSLAVPTESILRAIEGLADC